MPKFLKWIEVEKMNELNFFFFFQGKQSYGNIDDLSSHMDKLNTDRGR